MKKETVDERVIPSRLERRSRCTGGGNSKGPEQARVFRQAARGKHGKPRLGTKADSSSKKGHSGNEAFNTFCGIYSSNPSRTASNYTSVLIAGGNAYATISVTALDSHTTAGNATSMQAGRSVTASGDALTGMGFEAITSTASTNASDVAPDSGSPPTTAVVVATGTSTVNNTVCTYAGSNLATVLMRTSSALRTISGAVPGMNGTGVVNANQPSRATNGLEGSINNLKKTCAGTYAAMALAGLRHDDQPRVISASAGVGCYHDQAGLAIGTGGVSENGLWRTSVGMSISPALNSPDIGTNASITRSFP